MCETTETESESDEVQLAMEPQDAFVCHCLNILRDGENQDPHVMHFTLGNKELKRMWAVPEKWD